jgi:hypothetical protein
MDAFASTKHIGMIYARNADGTDQIIELIVPLLAALSSRP